MKKLSAMILVALMILSCFSACGQRFEMVDANTSSVSSKNADTESSNTDIKSADRQIGDRFKLTALNSSQINAVESPDSSRSEVISQETEDNSEAATNQNGRTVIIASWGTTKEPKATSKTYKQELELIDQIERKYNCKIDYYCIADPIVYYRAFSSETLAGIKFADIALLPGDLAFPDAALNSYVHCLDEHFDWNSLQWVDSHTNDGLLLSDKHYYLACRSDMRPLGSIGIKFRWSLFEKFGTRTPHDYIKNNNWNWETFEELSKTMTRSEDGKKYYGCEGALAMFSSNGVQPVVKTIDQSKYLFNLDTQAAYDCINFASRLYEQGYCPISNANKKVLWDEGLIAMSQASLNEMKADPDIGFAYYPIGPGADDYYYESGAFPLYVIPVTVNTEDLECIAAVLSDFTAMYSWRKSLDSQLAEYFSDSYSLEIAADIAARYAKSPSVISYYPGEYEGILSNSFNNYCGSAIVYIDSIRNNAQNEIDNMWKKLEDLP